MKNYKDYLTFKLANYSEKDIVITTHAEIRMIQRQINKSEVIYNIINPHRLKYALKEEINSTSEEKFDCYFEYSKTQCHRYILVIKDNIVIITIIKINRRWQRLIERKLNKRNKNG